MNDNKTLTFCPIGETTMKSIITCLAVCLFSLAYASGSMAATPETKTQYGVYCNAGEIVMYE